MPTYRYLVMLTGVLLMGYVLLFAAPPETPPAAGRGAPIETYAAPEGSSGIKEYRLNPYDVLEITVYREPDLQRTVRVSQDGYISFPLIGKVKVAGMDVLSGERLIAELLDRDYLVNPSVTIFVRDYNAKKVFVTGEVKTPGAYVITEDKGLTVLESIVLAGGFTQVADINKTRIIRMEKGVKKYLEVKISDITKNGDKSKDIVLQPNDIIFIPARLF